MFQKILVAIDVCSLDNPVFKQALNLAKRMGSRVLFVHVLSPIDEDYPDTVIYSALDFHYSALYTSALKRWQEDLSNYEQHRLELLRSLASEAEAAGITAELTQNIGDPGRTICAVAKTWDADLIVVGRRGRSGVGEWLLGSVSNYVMHHAPCSVLTIQGQDDATLEAKQQATATFS